MSQALELNLHTKKYKRTTARPSARKHGNHREIYDDADTVLIQNTLRIPEIHIHHTQNPHNTLHNIIIVVHESF